MTTGSGVGGLGTAGAPAGRMPPDDEAETPFNDVEKAEYERAMALITRVVNRRKAFQNLIKTIKEAKAKFMDEDAIKAGAQDGKFYTNVALVV